MVRVLIFISVCTDMAFFTYSFCFFCRKHRKRFGNSSFSTSYVLLLSFSLGLQKRHALRCYCQAMQVYKGKGWTLAEDHINFTIGRQSFTLRQPENAIAAFRHILIGDSKQSASQQSAFFREYLYVYRVRG